MRDQRWGAAILAILGVAVHGVTRGLAIPAFGAASSQPFGTVGDEYR